MNSGEGNGKPLLDSNCCLKNPLLDRQESVLNVDVISNICWYKES